MKRGADGKWYVRPYLGINRITGKPLRPYKCFPDAVDEQEAKRQAEAWAAGISKASELNVSRCLNELLPRYVMWLEDTGAPINTIKTYRSSAGLLSPFFTEVDPDDLTSFDVELVYATLMREGGHRGHPLSANTICRHHGFLASAYTWMLEKGICSRSPMPYVHKPSREKSLAFAFSDIELEVILESLEGLIKDDSTDPDHILERNYAMASIVAAYIGVREGEACGLDRGDINYRQKTVIVSATAVEDAGKAIRQNKTKGKRVRRVPAPESLLNKVSQHISWQQEVLPKRVLSGKSTDIPLFCDRRGDRIKPSDLSLWFSHLCSDLGLPPESHFHTLRHTFASVLLDEGADLRTIAELLGHAREGFTLETYAHMMPGRDRAAVDMFASAVRPNRGRDP